MLAHKQMLADDIPQGLVEYGPYSSGHRAKSASPDHQSSCL